MLNPIGQIHFQYAALVKTIAFTSAVFISFMQLISCSAGQTSGKNVNDPYIENLLTLYSERSISQQKNPLSADLFQPAFIEVLNKEKKIIVMDFIQRKLFLLNNEGEVVSKTGGSGRGPGEFELITGMHVGSDNHVYVHDGILKRITIYKVVDSEFILMDTKNYKTPDFYTLYRLLVTKYGIYGLYNESEGFHTPENRFLLYLLDRDFNPVEKKLNFPGEKRPQINTGGFLLYSPHDHSNKYKWHHEGDRFYFINNYEALIKGYNLQSEEIDIMFETNLPIRLTNEYYINAADNAYDFASNKDYWSVLENLETLPVLSGIWADSTNIILSIRPAPNDEIMMLYVNLEKDEITYFILPEGTGSSVFRDNIFYSIITDEEGRNYLRKTKFEH